MSENVYTECFDFISENYFVPKEMTLTFANLGICAAESVNNNTQVETLFDDGVYRPRAVNIIQRNMKLDA